MAKFLFVSYDGLIGEIAWECVKDGEDVRFWSTTSWAWARWRRRCARPS